MDKMDFCYDKMNFFFYENIQFLTILNDFNEEEKKKL